MYSHPIRKSHWAESKAVVTGYWCVDRLPPCRQSRSPLSYSYMRNFPALTSFSTSLTRPVPSTLFW